MLPIPAVDKSHWLDELVQARLHDVRRARYHGAMELLEAPLRTAEFLVIDTETNGLSGDQCELTEVGTVLVGGGELHERFSSVVRTNMPLRRGIQRFTGITQAMVDDAPPVDSVLPDVAVQLNDRVMVAHNAPFDRRVLQQAFERIGLEWPNPPVICTAQLARQLLPLQRHRGLKTLAEALSIEVEQSHRALPDAETCARVLCALFPRLCANAITIKEALTLLRPKRPPRPTKPQRYPAHLKNLRDLDFSDLPKDPGVYLFRDERGRTLYVGKSISIRSRARAHFAPSSVPADWTAHAAALDYRPTRSELGALVLENRLIKQLKPPGNRRLTAHDHRLVYIRCRLDIAFPILEVSPDPAPGHSITVGPLRGRKLALELVEQLDSLFGLRHCGRRLQLREHPSVYGQMGRCLSPCLGDLDPNLYRRRLDEALALFVAADGRAADRILSHVDNQMRAAAAAQEYERAEWLRRRARRLHAILDRLEGVLEAAHARPKLLLARHPTDGTADVLWVVGGRVRDWGPAPAAPELVDRTRIALLRGSARRGELASHLPPDEVDEMRIVATWLQSHPDTPQLELDPEPDDAAIAQFATGVQPVANGSSTTSAVTPLPPTLTTDPTGASRRTSASPIEPKVGEQATLVI
jgi:DNA polymerase-3 subunit epsilon